MRKNFKTFIFTALACTFLLGAGISARAESRVAINDTNFSSEVKREAEEADTNGDGYLSETEASKVKTLRFTPGYNLDSFKGIEYFDDITYFYYRGRAASTDYEDFNIYEDSTVSEINLGGFKKLERVKIDCRTPYLKTVDLEDCTNLKELTIEGSISNEGITSLNLKGCTNLQTVDCRDIFVNKLNLSGMKKLTSVSVFGNNMETLNLKKCSNLKTVDAGGDRLTKLKLKGAKKLEELNVRGDALETLDLSTNTKLKKLDSNCENIVSLDLRENKNIEKVECINNYKLAELKVKGCTKLKNIRCDNTALSKLNVKTNTNLRRLICRGTNLTKLNLKNNKKLKFLWCSNTGIQELNLSNTKIKDASGVRCDSDVSVTYAK